MKDSLYISRSFVEFGPFSVTEIQDFHKRGILRETDYVTADAAGEWVHVNEWAASLKAGAAPKPAAAKEKGSPPPAAAAPVAAPAKKAPAKKAAKKA